MPGPMIDLISRVLKPLPEKFASARPEDFGEAVKGVVRNAVQFNQKGDWS